MEYNNANIDATDEGDTTETTEDDSDEDDSEDSDDENYGAYSLAGKPTDFVPVEVKTKVKTKGGKNAPKDSANADGDSSATPVVQDHWSQQQQKALENALVQFPKGTTERWER